MLSKQTRQTRADGECDKGPASRIHEEVPNSQFAENSSLVNKQATHLSDSPGKRRAVVGH